MILVVTVFGLEIFKMYIAYIKIWKYYILKAHTTKYNQKKFQDLNWTKVNSSVKKWFIHHEMFQLIIYIVWYIQKPKVGFSKFLSFGFLYAIHTCKIWQILKHSAGNFHIKHKPFFLKCESSQNCFLEYSIQSWSYWKWFTDFTILCSILLQKPKTAICFFFSKCP